MSNSHKKIQADKDKMAEGDNNDSKTVPADLLTRFQKTQLNCEQFSEGEVSEAEVFANGDNVSAQEFPATPELEFSVTPELKFSAPFCGLPVEMWTKILDYVDYTDLKSLRATCVEMNENIVPVWSNFIAKSCFFYGGYASNLPLQDLNDKELILEFYNHFRLKNLLEGQEKEDWLSFFHDKSSITQSVRVLELKDCWIHWTDVFDLLSCFRNIEEFVISALAPHICKDEGILVLNHTFLLGLKEGMFVYQTEEWEARAAESPSLELLNLKSVTIHVPSLHFANAVVRILEHRCRHLEALSVSLLYAHIWKTPIKMTNPAWTFEAQNLMSNNKNTLKKFAFKLGSRFIPGSYSNTDMSKSCFFCKILTEVFKLKGLKLEELILDLPMLFGVTEGVVDAIQQRELAMSPIYEFLENQKETLNILRLSTIGLYPGFEERLEKVITSDLKVYLNAYTRNTSEKPEWNLLANKMESLNIDWHGGDTYANSVAGFLCSDHYDAVAGVRPPMTIPNIRSYIFYNYQLLFKNFDLLIVMDKFPNLTRLEIVNCSKVEAAVLSSDNESQPLAPGPGFNFSINDEMFQLILGKWPKLLNLYLDCLMSELTDFGLTGISHEALARMKRNNRFGLRPGDKIGFSLPRGLKSLKLFGVGKLVTNVTAWLAFRSMPSLMELILEAPKMSKTAKNYVEECFGRSPGFVLEIRNRKIPDPDQPKEVYAYELLENQEH